MSRILAHVRNNLVGYVALFVALSGTAYAAGTIGSDDIIDDSIRSIDVANDTSTGGGLAPADLRPDSVGSSEARDDGLKGVDIDEASLGSVPNADHATNSDKLGGRGAQGYQRRVIGTCDGGAIRAINGDGAVDCIDQAVFPISADLDSTDHRFRGTSFFPSNLSLLMRCDSSSAAADFINNGFDGATLNWLFSQGQNFPSSTVNASGTSVPGNNGANVITFGFTNRIEGQWIFADPDGVTTVNLHGFIAPGSPAFCEFKGTAEYAPIG